MQHESSITHRKNLESGLTVEWTRSTGDTDTDWSVVCYSDGSRWLFDNGSAQPLKIRAEVEDGLNAAEILETDSGAIVALYQSGLQSFSDLESWMESLSTTDRAKASSIL